jgi:hypothetical protein
MDVAVMVLRELVVVAVTLEWELLMTVAVVL